MATADKIERWVSLKTAARLAECSVSQVRAAVRTRLWRARRLGKGVKAHLRVAIGADNWPVAVQRARA